MAKDLNVNPYYSDDAAAKISNYYQILFNPSVAVQARELTQLQSLIGQQRRANFDTIYRNGTIVDGVDLAIKTVGAVTTAYISAGKFYYEGRIFDVAEQNMVITGSGAENLGLFVNEEFVTASADSTLVDPSGGSNNYGLAGADRLKITVQLIKIVSSSPGTGEKLETDDGVTKIWILDDGVLQLHVKKPQYSILGKVLAKRTFDESGHYLVEGMELTTEKGDVPEGQDPDTYDNPNLKVAVLPGLAYIHGYDNTFIAPRKTDVPRALTYKAKLNEPSQYSTGTSDYILFEPYVVTDATVEQIVVTAEIQVMMQIERGSGDYDDFDDANYGTEYSSIKSIVEIPGYVLDTDYELESDQVHWKSGGSKPSQGTDYWITFIYYKSCERGADKDFTVIEDTDESDIYYISWTGLGDLPVNGSNVLVDYYHYLARTDLFSLDKFGNIIRSAGIPTEYDKIEIPPFSDELLPLGWVKFQPGKDYDDVLIFEYNFKRTTMYDLHYLKKRVDDLEENVAALALEDEVKEGELSTTLKGIYVDPLNSLFKVDTGHQDFYCAINMVDDEATMVSKRREEDLNEGAATKVSMSTYKDSADADTLLTLQKTGETEFFGIKQKSATVNLNPHGIVLRKALSELSPRKDHWIDLNVIEKTLVQNRWRTTRTTVHNTKWSRKSRGSSVRDRKHTVGTQGGSTYKEQVKEKTILVGEKVERKKTVIGERLVTYCRQKTISVVGRNFTPAAYVACTFGGTQVKLLATSPYRNEESGGSTTGRIIIGSDGSWKGTFTIPPEIKSGLVEARFIDSGANNEEAIAIYSSRGVLRTVENRTTITRTRQKKIDIYRWKEPAPTTPIKVIPPLPPTNPPDPVPIPKPMREPPILTDPAAQSFIFSEDLILSSFDVFFATKADQNPKPVLEDELYDTYTFSPTNPVLIKIGLMINGYPDGENIIHQQELYPEDITTSLYGETATNIVLTEPVYLPAMVPFYISLGSKSTEYSIYVATLAEKDLETQQVITKNPYLDGVLFTSSNGQTWTARQDQDMAIVLYQGTFATSGSVTLPSVTFPLTAEGSEPAMDGYARFMFCNESYEVPNSRIVYYYTTDAGTTWKPFNPGEEIDTESGNTTFQVKAELTGDGATTPFVDSHTSLFFYVYDIGETNMYITKGVDPVPAYNSMKLILDEATQSQTSIIKEFTFDGTQWLRFLQTTPDESVDIGGGFYRNHYIMKFSRIEKLTISNKAGGDFIIGATVNQAVTGATGEIVGINATQTALWVIHDSDSFTSFTAGNGLIGTPSADVDIVDKYTSEPSYPTYFRGRIYLESSAYWKSPILRNIRWVMRITY